jgi:deubiquitinase DESI2
MAYSSIGRRKPAVTIYVNLYDLSPANELILHTIGLGLYHSGVEVLGSEYTFAASAGIFSHTPRDAGPQAKFRSQLTIGTFEGGPAEVQAAIRALANVRFGPDDYDILQNNCNTFANALCYKLCGIPLPAYVNRAADYGVFCKCLFPKEVLKGSPVNNNADNGAPESTALLTTSTTTTVAFSGTGSKLGGISGSLSTSSGSSSTGHHDAVALTDRRDKARLAALARLELQQQAKQSSSGNNNEDKSS